MSFTIQLTGVIKVGSGLLNMAISPSVTTIEEWLQIRQKMTAGENLAQLGQGGLTSIDFAYLQFIDATTLLPTHAKILALTDLGTDAPAVADAPHQTEFLYINSTGTSALGINITAVAACYVVGILGGAA